MATKWRFKKRQYTQYQYEKEVKIPSWPIDELYKAGTVVHDTDSDNLIFITTMWTQHPLA